ncbi:MAG TPA: extracellular solute-binding protein [Caldilineaceae bacterium]|nr:extracellular solute-binding protein [Caldilineaceae bacterium]
MRYLALLVWLITLFLLTACLSRQVPPPRTPAERCGLSTHDLAALTTRPATAARPPVTVSLWALAYGNWCWRAYLPLLAAQDVETYAVTVEATPFLIQTQGYRRQIEQAAAQHALPDLLYIPDFATATAWIDAGYLTPLDHCIAAHNAFRAVRPDEWERYRVHEKNWLIPLENQMSYLFFSKRKLRELGWREAEIAALPEAIAQGAFTLSDLMMVAQQAMARGVVKDAFAFWPDVDQLRFFSLLYFAHLQQLNPHEAAFYRSAPNAERRDCCGLGAPPTTFHRATLLATFTTIHNVAQGNLFPTQFAEQEQRSWVAELMRQDVVASSRVLFWIAPSYDWTSWATDYQYEQGGYPYLEQQVGYAPFPAIAAAQPGVALWVESSFYGVTSVTFRADQRSGPKMDVLCSLLAKSMQPPYLHRLTGLSGSFSPLVTSGGPQADAWKSNYQRSTEYMWPYVYPLPLFISQIHWPSSAVAATIRLVERGELTPEAATDQLLRTLPAPETE